jgi:hypothetical protein
MANSNGWGDGAANNSIGWGQGANNAIAWGDSHAKSWAGATDIVGLTTDPDAQAFITAAAITDPTQQAAIDNLVKGLKSDNIWTKMKAIYPFVGGTASTHKWNLKDPRDLDAAFRLVFNGGWTHSSTGATPNGTNGYADTYLIASSVLSLNNAHLSFYSRTNTITNNYDIGCAQSAYGYLLALSLKGDLVDSYNFVNDLIPFGIPVADSLGLQTISRITNSEVKINKNAISRQTLIKNSTQIPAHNVFIGALSLGGTAARFSNRQVAFSTIGDGLTDTEAANLYTRVQAYQTALSRQV